VLGEFGIKLPKDTEIRVWDSTAETRFIVLPMRPAGTEGLSEQQLAELVTRDSMIGTGLPRAPGEAQRCTACTTWAAWTASARARSSPTSRRSTSAGRAA